jgi:hypothetical protein
MIIEFKLNVGGDITAPVAFSGNCPLGRPKERKEVGRGQDFGRPVVPEVWFMSALLGTLVRSISGNEEEAGG